jgi:hypothetical protein
VTAYLLGQDRAEARRLARLLPGSASKPSAGVGSALTLAQVLSASTVSIDPSSLQRQRGWVQLLQDVESQFEGLLYYAAIPRLSARDALLATSIMATAAEHSALLAGLNSRASIKTAVPTALVRGMRLRDQPPW